MLARERLTQIDVFHSLGLDEKEEFHSNYLAWLLSPRESRSWLLLPAGCLIPGWRAPCCPCNREIQSPEYSLFFRRNGSSISEFRTTIRRLLCHENKVWSAGERVAARIYREALDTCFPGYRVKRIYLTPNGALPEDSREREYWTPMTYRGILRLVERTIEEKSESIHADVKALLRQYATTIRRNIVPEVSDDVH